jgi:hypothetical protein
MAKEESKLVDEVVENTESKENKDEFNPLAFAGDDVYGEIKDSESTDESKEEEVDEDGWAWDNKPKEEDVVENKEEEYNWDGEEATTEEAPTSEESLNWVKVGKELGIEIESKDQFVEALNTLQQKALQKEAPVTDQVAELKNYMKFSDRDLVAEELKADGIEDSEIEDSLDKLEDSGMMKMKAKSIRRVLTNAIDQQTNQAIQEKQQQAQQRTQQTENAKKELKSQIKNMSEFMGGKVTKKQKEEVYRYATGDMMKEIYADHANVADVAMFMLYREQIEKILRSQGLEDGKAAIMNSIVSPSLNTGKSKSNFKVKSGKFDPKAFMNE